MPSSSPAPISGLLATLRPIVLTLNPASSSSSAFTIADRTTVNLEPGAATASSTSSQRIPLATPHGVIAVAVTVTCSTVQASRRQQARRIPRSNSRVPTRLSPLSPVLTSLQRQGNGSTAIVLRRIVYEPAPVNNRNPGLPAGLIVFNPKPTDPATAPRTSASVPDGGATLSLLGIGLLGTALMKRKFAK